MVHRQAAINGMTFDEALALVPYSKTFDVGGTDRTYNFTDEDRISAARELIAREQDAIERNAMTPAQQELVDLRKSLGITQVQMSAAIGMPVRTYQMLENGKSATKPWHLKAAQYAAMEFVAVPGRSAADLPRNVRDVAETIALMLEQES